MKDIIENRVRLDGPTKARLLAMSLKENGLLWTSLVGIYYATSAIGEKAFSIAATASNEARSSWDEQRRDQQSHLGKLGLERQGRGMVAVLSSGSSL